MADKKISELVSITGSATAADDYFVVVDTSGAVTYKISREELNNAIEQDVLSSIEITDITNDVNVQGTVTADDTLQVDGNQPKVIFVETDASTTHQVFSAGGNFYLATDTSGVGSKNIIFRNNGTTERMRIDSSGQLIISGNGGSANNSLDLSYNGASGQANIQADSSGGSTYLTFGTSLAGSVSERLRIDSSGNVGIGTSSPAYKLDVSDAIRVSKAVVLNPATSSYYTTAGTLSYYGATNAVYLNGALSGILKLSANGDRTCSIELDSSNTMEFITDSTERMRIDSSGNLLVGTTSIAPATTTSTGIAIRADGKIDASASAQPASRLNRTTSDGDILQFRKDGTTVGSIGVYGSRLYAGTGDVGLWFNDQADYIAPINTSTATLRDAAVDIGNGSYRFNNLYLSGGVYLGGTGSANALEDYEEGSWVPTIQGSTTNPSGISYSIQDGTYTKIGRMVYVMFRVRFSFTSGTGAGNLEIAGLPVASTNYAQPKSPPQHDNLSFTGFEYLEMGANSNTATIGLAKNRSGSSASSLSLSDCNAGFTDINGGLFYFTS